MSFSKELKDLIKQRTLSEFNLPNKRQRPSVCCRNSFENAAALFSGESVSYREQVCARCPVYFLRGAFVTAGYLADPKKRYHLEIRIPDEKCLEALKIALNGCGFTFKTATRGTKSIFYIKNSEDIEDFLTMCACQDKAMELMELKVERSVKNRINRVNNYDGANLQRTINFSGKLKDAIEFLKSNDAFERLPENLKNTAALRGRYPGASLSELCALSKEKLTKSGLNHRFQRIIEEADRLRAHLTAVCRDQSAKGDV